MTTVGIPQAPTLAPRYGDAADPASRARLPDRSGVTERDGVALAWESYGDAAPTLVLMPTWSIVPSRIWKAQVPYLARHFRVVTFDGRGSGASGRPAGAAAYTDEEYAADTVAVMDAAGVDRAVLVSLSCGAAWSVHVAAGHPERVQGLFAIAPSCGLDVADPRRDHVPWNVPLPSASGWEKYNKHYWLEGDYDDFLRFFFAQMFSEPHSTKQREDAIAWGRQVSPQTLADTTAGRLGCDGAVCADVQALCARITQPVTVLHGSDDRVRGLAYGERLAELTGGHLVVVEGAGHGPLARDPVLVNHEVRAFAEQFAPPVPRHTRTRTRAAHRPRRVLYISSPIGLGHARRDVAVARELRRLQPDLQVEWLAQDPVTRVLADHGEHVHPASRHLANESGHVEHESGEHDLHAFRALRRMDEIMVNNFMVFDELMEREDFDLVIGDEAWDVDYFLHENPRLKRTPYAWFTDFVGWLPMPDGGDEEAALTADLNAEMIEHRARFRALRDRSIFVGSADDVVPDRFGPGLPTIREWTEQEFDFAGYVTGFDPSAYDVDEIRARLGHRPDESVCLVSVGGSGVGLPLLRRVLDAVPLAREAVPGAAVRGRDRSAHRPAVAADGAGCRGARLPAGPHRAPGRLRRRPHPGRPHDVHGADRPAQAVRLRAAAAPLRAELPRAAAAGPLPRRHLPGLRVGQPARRAGGHAGRRARPRRGLPPGGDRRGRAGRTMLAELSDGVGALRSRDLDDLAVAGQRAAEQDGQPRGRGDVHPVDGLQVQVGLGAVAGVAAAAHERADGDGLAGRDGDSAPPQVAQGHQHSRRHPDHDVVAGQARPPAAEPSALGECVGHGGEAPLGVVVVLAVVDRQDGPRRRREDRASEAGEPVRRLGDEQRREPQRGRATPRVHRHEVDRVRRGEQVGAVAGHPVGGAVPDEPPPTERVRELHGGCPVSHDPAPFGGRTRSGGRADEQRDARERQHGDDTDPDGPALVLEEPGHGTPAGARAVGTREPGLAEEPPPVGVPLEGQRRERRDRGREAEHEPAEGPALVGGHQDRDQSVGDEHDAVDHAEDLHAELGRLGDVLEEHPGRSSAQVMASAVASARKSRRKERPSCERGRGERGEEAQPVGAGATEVLDGVSGWGIRPTTLPRALVIPAMSRAEPLGLP